MTWRKTGIQTCNLGHDHIYSIEACNNCGTADKELAFAISVEDDDLRHACDTSCLRAVLERISEEGEIQGVSQLDIQLNTAEGLPGLLDALPNS